MDRYSSDLKIVVHKILLKYPSLLPYIREDKYRIADSQLTYRQINSLDQSNLLRDRREFDKQWRSFNLNDLLYLHIISYAKLFSATHERLRYLKSMFYDDGINFKDVGELSYSEIALIALLTGVIPIGILMFSDGDVVLTDDSSTPFSVGYPDQKQRTFVYMMLYETFKPQLSRVFADPGFTIFDLSEFANDYSVKPMTRRQRALLNIVDENDFSEITITKRKNGELIINATRTVDGSTISRADILKIFDQKDFGHIKLTKQHGKDASYRVEEVIKV